MGIVESNRSSVQGVQLESSRNVQVQGVQFVTVIVII